MRRRLLSVAAPFVQLLNSIWTLVAFVAVVAAVWLPYVYASNVPHFVSMGVVQETTMTDYVVVELDPGVFTVFEDDAFSDEDPPAAGEEVSVFDSTWNSPVMSGSTGTAWVVTAFAGFLGLVVVTFLVGFFGGGLVESLHGAVERSARRHGVPTD